MLRILRKVLCSNLVQCMYLLKLESPIEKPRFLHTYIHKITSIFNWFYYYSLKPRFLGGFYHCLQWFRLREIAVWGGG